MCLTHWHCPLACYWVVSFLVQTLDLVHVKGNPHWLPGTYINARSMESKGPQWPNWPILWPRACTWGSEATDPWYTANPCHHHAAIQSQMFLIPHFHLIPVRLLGFSSPERIMANKKMQLGQGSSKWVYTPPQDHKLPLFFTWLHHSALVYDRWLYPSLPLLSPSLHRP